MASEYQRMYKPFEDVHGNRVTVGVDYNCVTIDTAGSGRIVLTMPGLTRLVADLLSAANEAGTLWERYERRSWADEADRRERVTPLTASEYQQLISGDEQ